MTPNESIIVEQTENGFVVRPLRLAQQAALTPEARVFGVMENLRRWLSTHFACSECPRCGRVTERCEYFLFATAQSVFRCQKCSLFTVFGSGEWINSENMNVREFEEKINELSRKADGLK